MLAIGSSDANKRGWMTDGKGEFMTLCSYGHDEVCYETKRCPCCDLKQELEDLKREMEKL